MNILAELPYIKVIREITWNQQNTIEETHQLLLLKDIILSNKDEFKFHEVHDISHRQMSEESGFLYLHTNKGVFSFYIKTDPKNFIDTYKELKEM